MALPATENFTGTNGNEVRTLSNWDGASYVSSGAFDIQSNAAAAGLPATSAGVDWWTADSFDADHYSEATITGTANGVYHGVAVRCSGTDNSNNHSGYCFYSAPDDGCYIDEYSAGSYQASSSSGTAFASSDVVRAEASGSTITGYINDSQELQITDSTLTTGAAGIAAYQGSTSATLDDWEGGNVGAGTAHELTAAVTIASTTPNDVALNQAWGLTAAVTIASTTPDDVQLSVGNNITLTGAVTIASTTPDDVELSNAWALTGAVTIASTTPDDVTLAIGTNHQLTAAVTIASTTPDTVDVKIPSGACVGGVLAVNGTNARYLENDSGPVFLAGFHTWYDVQDGGDSNPPSAFDWDAYLTALTTTYGCNFTKLWTLETAQNWADPGPSGYNPQYFTTVTRYARTGPGNANDGGLKFDLTQVNPIWLGRLRNRAIEAGNAGVYVCVQFFQGWQIDTKGGTDNPWTYHPYNSDNNINSLDGDFDDDGEGTETHTDTNNAAWTYQQDLIEAVIDELNDLDNVIWEVSNEDTASTGNTDWQADVISHIATYESGKPKQHLIGMTKQWPNGQNSTLDASGADWVSYDADKADAVHAATDPVSMYDTDHTLGITSDESWIFEAFTNGHGGAWYMDEWDGALYGTDRRSNATYQLIRTILGYTQTYAALMDLENATPQPSLSDTGYCLAKTTGRVELLAYQDGTGNVQVTLTGLSGNYTVDWLRLSNGDTSAGSNVAGGAARTLTNPWSEAAVVYLRQIVELTAAVTIASTTPDDVSLTNAIALTAAVTIASTTPDDVSLTNAWALTAVIAAASTTPDDVTLINAWGLTAAVSITSSTPDDVALNLAHALTAAITVASTTPDDVELSNSWSLTAAVSITSTTPDDVTLINVWGLTAAIGITSSTPDDVTLSISGNITLTAAVGITSSTPDDVTLANNWGLTAAITAASTTPDDVTLYLGKLLTGAIGITSTTPDDVALVNNWSLTAAIGATSTTPDDITLVLAHALVAAITIASATPDDVVLSTDESLIVGLLLIGITASRPEVTITASRPEVTITSKGTGNN